MWYEAGRLQAGWATGLVVWYEVAGCAEWPWPRLTHIRITSD